MSVYVDDMKAPFGRMIMCHMIADTDEELHAMAERIGVARKWHQHAGTHRSHYDIALSKRRIAVANGAVEITWRELGMMIYARRPHPLFLAEGMKRKGGINQTTGVIDRPAPPAPHPRKAPR